LQKYRITFVKIKVKIYTQVSFLDYVLNFTSGRKKSKKSAARKIYKDSFLCVIFYL